MVFDGIRLLDPAAGRDERLCAEYRQGQWQEVARPASSAEVVSGEGLILAPGLWDVHVHFRDPGNPAAETTESGLEAAFNGGFHHVVTMPNTMPACDNPALIAAQRGNELVELLPSACITKARAGKEAADFQALAEAGAAAFTDDGSYVNSDEIMFEAMRFAAAHNLPVMDHAVCPEFAIGAVVRDCALSRKLQLGVFPDAAEVEAVKRDIELCERTGVRLDIQHVSSAQTVALIREARKRGVKVTGEATPHHLALCTDDICEDDASRFKMNPPLGTREDMLEIRKGVLDGTLSLFATDHAPHTEESKSRGFAAAPFGIIGMESALGVTWKVMVEECAMPPLEFIRRWTQGPAELLGRKLSSVFDSGRGILIDTRGPFKIEVGSFKSKSRNCPFDGWSVPVAVKTAF